MDELQRISYRGYELEIVIVQDNAGFFYVSRQTITNIAQGEPIISARTGARFKSIEEARDRAFNELMRIVDGQIDSQGFVIG